MRSSSAFFRLLALCVLFAGWALPVLGQQGTLQVLMPNVPPVLTAPYLSDLQQDLERGQYPIQFIYTNTDASPLTFRLRLRFERNGQVWVESTSNPVTVLPGVTLVQRPGYDDLLTFNDDAQSLIDRVPVRDRLLLATTGALPEGIYSLALTPELEAGSAGVVAVPSFNVFQVRYTSPPVAFLPQQDARVTTTPIFAWTPVLPGPGGQIVYRVRLVEVLPGQNDEAALTANRTWAEAEVNEATWTYTLDNQPLEAGKRYAWTVVAVDLNERTLFLGDGRNRTQGFVYAPIETPVIDPAGPEVVAGMPYVLDTPAPGTFFDDPRLSFAWSFGAAGGAAVAGKPITLVISPVGGVPLIRRAFDTRLGPQLRYTLSAAEARQLTPGMYQWSLEMEGRAASETRMFQFGEVVPAVPEVVIPARPIALLQPAMGAEVTTLTPEFSWSRPVAAGTELVFRANADPAAVVLRVPVAEGSVSYRLTPSQALSLGVQSFAWTLEGPSGLLSSVSRFAFSPSLPFTPTAPNGEVEFLADGVMVVWASNEAPDWKDALQAGDLTLWVVLEDVRRQKVAEIQAPFEGGNVQFVPTPTPLTIGVDYRVYLEARTRSGAGVASGRMTFRPIQGSVTLDATPATVTALLPTFRWRVPEGVQVQQLAVVLEGVDDRDVRMVLPVSPASTALTLTPEQALSLDTGRRYQWTLEVDGTRLPTQTFRYAPRVEAVLMTPASRSVVLPYSQMFRWSAPLPAGFTPNLAHAIVRVEQGNLYSDVAVPLGTDTWTVDLGRLVRDGFNPVDSLSWRVMLKDQGAGRWTASSAPVRFRLGMPGFAFTAPEAGSTVTALLPTLSWTGIQGTPERLALILSVGRDSIRIPLPVDARAHTLTPRQVLRLPSVASAVDGIAVRLEVDGVVLPDVHAFFYEPSFAATLGEATFDAVRGQFTWTLDGVPQELLPFVEPMLVLDDDTGPNVFLGGTPRSQVVTQQELTSLRGKSWRPGQSYAWRVGLTTSGAEWSAFSTSVSQVTYVAPAPPIASVFSTLQPADEVTLNTFDPVFSWDLTLPNGVTLDDVRVRLTVQERAGDASVPPQEFVVAGRQSRQQVMGLRRHATYEWTLDLLPVSDDAALPDALLSYSSDQLRSPVRTFTIQRTFTVPDRYQLFATPFARLEEPALQSDPATGLLQGASELILELDPASDDDLLLPAIQGEDVAPPAPVQPQGRTLPVDIQNLQVVVTSEGNVVPVGGGLSVDLQGADPSEAFRLPFPGFDISSISWGRIDGRLSIPQVELDALQGLALEDLLGRGIGALRLGGQLRLPQEGLACNGGEVTIDLAASSLTMRPSGTVEGTLNVPITCEFAVGPFTARITQSVLHFAGGRSGQRATLDAAVEVQISENQTAVGAMTYDLVRQRVVAFSAELTQPFDLPLPLSAPVFTFNVQRAQINLDNLVIDGRQTLALPGGQSLGVTFDSLGVRLRDGSIAHGQILFDDGLALQAGIDAAAQGAQGFRFEAVAYDTLGTHFSLTDGVYLGVGAQASLGVDGFQAEGQARAMLRVGDLRIEETLIATFDETARLGLLPPSVLEGRIDLSWRGVNVAWADPAGFHLDRTALLGAVLPDTLPLPTMDIAYLVLRDPVSQELRVTYEFQNDGTIRFDQRPGYQMEIVAPALASPAGVIPRMQVVTFRDVRFGLGRIVRGGIYAEVARFEDAIDLTGMNIPMFVTGMGFAGLPADSPDNLEGFQIKGVFAPFNNAPNPANVFSLALSGDRLIGSVDFPALEQNINVAGNGQVVLDLSSVNGSLDVPLPHRIAQTGPGEFDLTFDGRLAVRNADSNMVAASDLTLVLQRQGGITSLQTFNPAPVIIPETAWLGLPGPVDLGIDSLRTYSLSWVEGSGFTFEMDFDAQVRIGLTGAQAGDPFQFPLAGVRLDEQGFTIPPQSWHEGNVPSLANHPGYNFNVGILYPRAMRTQQSIRFSWFQPGVQFSNAFLPEFDFRVRMADFYGSNPVEDGHDLFFENVTFRNGVLEGTFTYEAALTDPVTGRPLRIATLPLGPSNLSPAPPAIAVERVIGTLRAGVQGQQVLELGIEGYLPPAIGPFAPADPAACPYAEVSLTLVEGPGLAGSVSGVAACLERDFGPITLRALPGQNNLTFAFGNGQQQARFDGGVQVELPPVQEGGPRPAFNGTVALDLVRGTFLDGEIRTNAPFSIPVPLQAADPLFTVTVQEAVLNRAGFTLTGSGNLRVPEGSVGMSFDSLRFNLDTGAILSGEATLTSQLALESAVSPLDFRFVDPTATPLAIDDVPQEGFRVDVNGSVTLNRDGLHLNGAATAGLRAFDTNSPGLRVAFDPDEPTDQGFSLAFNRRAVVGGKATFFATLDGREAPLVTLTRNGWEIDPLRTVVEALIPDTLFLPSREIAYLVLRDTDAASPTFGQLRVDHTTTPGVVTTLPNLPVKLSIPSLGIGTGQRAAIDVAFSARVDAQYNIIVDTLLVNFDADAISLGNDFPFELVGASYVRARANPFGVMARLDLEQLLGGQPGTPLLFDIQVGPNGLSGVAEAGIVRNAFDPVQLAETPVLTLGSAQDVHLFIRGVRFSFGGAAPSYALSGDLTAAVLQPTSLSGAPTNEQAGRLFLAGSFASGAWNFTATSAGAGTLKFGAATFQPDAVNGLGFTLDASAQGTTAAFVMNGQMHFGALLDGFSLEVEELRMGVRRNAAGWQSVLTLGRAANLTPHQLQLFGGAAQLNIPANGAQLSISNTALQATIGQGQPASMRFRGTDRNVTMQNMVISTRGTFTFDEIAVQNVGMVGEWVAINRIGLRKPQASSPVELVVDATVTLPDPFAATSQLEIAVRKTPQGNIQFQVDGPTFNFGPNGPTVAFGDVGRLVLTGFSLEPNLQNNLPPVFYVTSEFVFGADPAAPNARRIVMGNAADIRNNYGIRVSPRGLSCAADEVTLRGACVGYRVAYLGQPFEIDLELINLRLDYIGLQPANNDPFTLEVRGIAGLNLPGVGGRAGFEDFRFNRSGLISAGRFANGAAFFLLPSGENDGLLRVEVGSFASGRNTSIQVERGAGNNASPSLAMQTVQVRRFLRFGGQGQPALQLTINAADLPISAGVREVLFYETTTGTKYLRVSDANLSLHDQLSVNASFEYEGSANNTLVRVSGRGEFAGQAVVAVGKFARGQQGLSIGVFVAATSNTGIPLVPGLVDLTGIGGGFFLRPDAQDFQMVNNAVNLWNDPYLTDRRDAVIGRNAPLFSIFLYASAGFIGTNNVYALTGQALITITDDFSMIQADASVAGMNNVRAGLVLAVEYTPAALTGAVLLEIDIPVVLNLRAGMDFFASSQTWAINGFMEGDLLRVLTVRGDLFLGPPGYYLGVTVRNGRDFGVFSYSATLEFEIWNVRGSSFGAYLAADASVRAFGVGFSAGVKGAYIARSSRRFVYGSAYVELDWLPDFRGWVKFENGGIDGGLGRNKEYERLISQARNEAQAMAGQAQQAAAQLTQAQQDLETARQQALADAQEAAELERIANAPQLRPLELMRAGVNMIAAPQAERQDYINRLSVNELNPNRFGPRTPAQVAARNWILNTVLAQGLTPYDHSTRLTRLQQRLAALNSTVPGVEDRLRNSQGRLENLLISLQDDADALGAMRSPVTVQRGADRITGFAVDTLLAAQQASALEAEMQANEQLDAEYRTLLQRATNNLAQFDQVLSGRVGQALTRLQILSQMQITPIAIMAVQGKSAAGTQQTSANPGPGFVPANPASRVSVEEAARLYMEATETLAEYYAYRLDEVWRNYTRSDAWIREFQVHKDPLLETIRQPVVGGGGIGPTVYVNGSEERFRLAATISRERYRILTEALRMQPAGQMANTLYDALNFRPQSAAGRTAHGETFMRVGREFWVDAFETGISLHGLGASISRNTVTTRFNRDASRVMRAHESLTEAIDDLYDLKVDYATTLYSMYDSYYRWRATTGQETQEVNQRLGELASALTPPRITNIGAIIVNQNNSAGFRAQGLASWTIVPSPGDSIAEISIRMHPTAGPGSTPYLARYRTLGRLNFLPIHTARTNSNENAHTFALGVRARSSGGATAERAGSFTVSVNRSVGRQNTVGGILPVDNTPPVFSAVPQVESNRTTPAGELVIYGQTIRGANSVTWLNNVSAVRITVRVLDPESGIESLEYAFGTTVGGTDVQDYRPLFGSEVAPSLTEAIVRSLVFPEDGTPVFLSVRATNGAGLSRVSSSTLPVRFDGTASSVPTSVRLRVAQRPAENTTPVQTTAPAITLPTTAVRGNDPLAQAANRIVEWAAPAEQGPSGISGYNVVVAPERLGADAFTDPRFTPTSSGGFLTLNANTLSFTDTMYVHIQPRSRSLATGAVAMQPVILQDPTPPSAPNGVAAAVPGALRFYITTSAEDAESGVERYELAIGTTPGGQDVVSWRNAITQPWSVGPTPRFFHVPNADLPQGPVYLSVRAVNRQGAPSRPVTSGPIHANAPAPSSAPVVGSVQFAPVNQQLRIPIVVNGDPVGTTSVTVQVQEQQFNPQWLPAATWQTIQQNPQGSLSWTPVQGNATVYTELVNPSTSIMNFTGLVTVATPPRTGGIIRAEAEPDPRLPRRFEITVRVTNAGGLSVTRTLTHFYNPQGTAPRR